jgi:hypothetical protein
MSRFYSIEALINCEIIIKDLLYSCVEKYAFPYQPEVGYSILIKCFFCYFEHTNLALCQNNLNSFRRNIISEDYTDPTSQMCSTPFRAAPSV